MGIYGPPYAVDGPAPSPPLITLLSSIEVVDEPGPEWGNGVQIRPYGVGPARTYDPCSTAPGSLTTSPLATVDQFGSVMVYLQHECTTRGATFAEERDRLLTTFASVEAAQVENQVWTGGNSVGHALTDSGATPINGASATAPGVALGLLEQAIAASGRRGMIHATPRVVSQWSQSHALVSKPGRLETMLGTVVVPGYGYAGTAPAGLTATSGLEAYAIATGLMQARREAAPTVLGADDAESVTRSNNVRTISAQRLYVVTWDSSLRAAVRVSLS
jgi:hypothetical protein